MTALAVDDAWQQTCLIAISALDGSDVQFAGLTETVKMDFGDKDTEGKPLCNGGRVTKFNAEGDATISFEAYPMEAGNGKGFYDLLHETTGAAPQRIINNRIRTKYRILLLWTNQTSVTTAEQVITDTYSGIRVGLAGAYFTKHDMDFSDGELKFTVEAKAAAFDKSGNGQKMLESCAGASETDILPAIASYTASYYFAAI